MPPVKNKLLFVVSMALVLVVLGFVADRVVFLVRAEHATGEVTELSSYNTTCGRKRSRHACTQFRAHVRYTVNDEERSLDVSAGSSRGNNRPLSEANYARGSKVPVLYTPRNPNQAYRDTFFDVWGAPLMAFFPQIATLVGAFSEKRRSV